MRNISFATMAELAAAGKLLPLDKYLNDPENYPIFAEADMQELLKFRVNGVLYGILGFGWRIRRDDRAELQTVDPVPEWKAVMGW